jgi:hypothetical protein
MIILNFSGVGGPVHPSIIMAGQRTVTLVLGDSSLAFGLIVGCRRGPRAFVTVASRRFRVRHASRSGRDAAPQRLLPLDVLIE